MSARWLTPRRVAYAVTLAVLILVLFPVIALADNCGSIGDCWATALGGALGGLGLAGLAAFLGLPQPAVEPPPSDPLSRFDDANQRDRDLQQQLQKAQEDALNHRQQVRDHENALRNLIRGVNPSGSMINCGKVFDAVDRSLGDGRHHSAPGGFNGSDEDILRRHHAQINSYSSSNDLQSSLQGLPDGSRGGIGVDWVDGTRHIFNYVKQDGVVYYIEGQTGKVTTDITDIIGTKGTDWDGYLKKIATYPPGT